MFRLLLPEWRRFRSGQELKGFITETGRKKSREKVSMITKQSYLQFTEHLLQVRDFIYLLIFNPLIFTTI